MHSYSKAKTALARELDSLSKQEAKKPSKYIEPEA